MPEQTRRRRKASVTPAAAAEPAFGAAIDEVERILARLEAEQVEVDDLAREVRRAVELIGICRRKLAATETDVRAYVDALRAPDASPPSGPPGGGPADADPREAADAKLPF